VQIQSVIPVISLPQKKLGLSLFFLSYLPLIEHGNKMLEILVQAWQSPLIIPERTRVDSAYPSCIILKREINLFYV
jgi:hypothetical protein